MKFFFISLLIIPTMGMSQNQLLGLVDEFAEDSVHVYPSTYTNIDRYIKDGVPLRFEGTEITKTSLDHYNIYETHTQSTKFYALEKFDFGSSLYGLIVGVKTKDLDDSKIGMWMINTKSDSIVEMLNLAYYKIIPGTMEEIMNAWITDLDDDGDLDIGIMVSLTDYEFPNDYSDNISGVEGYGYYIQDGVFSFDYLTEENYMKFVVKR